MYEEIGHKFGLTDYPPINENKIQYNQQTNWPILYPTNKKQTDPYIDQQTANKQIEE